MVFDATGFINALLLLCGGCSYKLVARPGPARPSPAWLGAVRLQPIGTGADECSELTAY